MAFPRRWRPIVIRVPMPKMTVVQVNALWTITLLAGIAGYSLSPFSKDFDGDGLLTHPEVEIALLAVSGMVFCAKLFAGARTNGYRAGEQTFRESDTDES